MELFLHIIEQSNLKKMFYILEKHHCTHQEPIPFAPKKPKELLNIQRLVKVLQRK